MVNSIQAANFSSTHIHANFVRFLYGPQSCTFSRYQDVFLLVLNGHPSFLPLQGLTRRLLVMITMDFGISPGCYQVEGVKTLNYSGNSVVK